jgi:hypothetical protein
MGVGGGRSFSGLYFADVRRMQTRSEQSSERVPGCFKYQLLDFFFFVPGGESKRKTCHGGRNVDFQITLSLQNQAFEKT